MVPFKELLYLEDQGEYVEATQVPEGARVASISGTQVREEYLAKGLLLP
jgi:sulfate adenylyltransferase